MRMMFAACLLTLMASGANAQSSAIEIETERYLSCLDRVETDHETAFEDALAWRMEGGGWPAAHCEARALVALGDIANGAAMLEELASSETAGRDEPVRVAMLVEAGEAWLSLEQAENAGHAFTAALELAPLELDALLGQAKASAALGEWEMAENAATASIEQVPGLADAWRLRALARLETGALDAAWSDIETARALESDNIEILVLRGRVNEARRVAAQEG